MTTKITLKVTTIKTFDSVEEYQAFVTDIENSKQFDFKTIVGLRNRDEVYSYMTEPGYFGGTNISTTRFEHV